MNKCIVKAVKADDELLAKVNAHTLEPVTSEQVYIFKIAACNNDIDRDFEVFPESSLHQLAKLYIGKTVLMDHKISVDKQTARIFDATVEYNGRTSLTGEAGADLILWCYMLNNEKNADIISEIKAGIKKEVSVGCSVASGVCSICGADNRRIPCEHRKGYEYDGKLCYIKLENPKDAYEVSFVAVPAQPAAGVTKEYSSAPPAAPQHDGSSILSKLKKIYSKKGE